MTDEARDAEVAQNSILLTIAEGAALLRCSPDVLRQYIHEGAIPHIRLGRTAVRVRRTDLEKFVADRLTTDWTPAEERRRKAAS